MKKLFKRGSAKEPRSQKGVVHKNLESIPEEIRTEGIEQFCMNRKLLPWEKLRTQLETILQQERLTALGGILLKAGIENDIFHLGIIPNFLEGERGYHHDIHLKHETELTLIGGISAGRELSLLFKCLEMDDVKRADYRKGYRVLSRIIALAADPETITLDWITTHIIEDQKITSSVHASLRDLMNLE